MKNYLIPSTMLQEYVQNIFEAVGLPEKDAFCVAELLVHADLRNVHSHGVLRTVPYVEKIQQGGASLTSQYPVVFETPNTAVIDADDDGLAVLQVRHLRVRGKRHRRMRGAHLVHVVRFADRRLVAVKLLSVPGGDASLHERRIGRHRDVALAHHRIGTQGRLMKAFHARRRAFRFRAEAEGGRTVLVVVGGVVEDAAAAQKGRGGETQGKCAKLHGDNRFQWVERPGGSAKAAFQAARRIVRSVRTK